MEEQSQQVDTGTAHAGSSASEEAPGLFCPHCGVRNVRGARYCMHCGEKLTSPPARNGGPSAAPDDVDEEAGAILAQAFRKHAAGDTDAAIELCLQVLKLNPNSSSAHSLLGILYEHRGDRELAIEEFAKVLELNPGSIADRAKLDELRDGAPGGPPPKVNWSRRIAAPVLTDNPAAALVYAIAVFFIVLLVGGLVVWSRTHQKGSGPLSPAATAALRPAASAPAPSSPAAPVAGQPPSPQPVTPAAASGAMPAGYPQGYGTAPAASPAAPQPRLPQEAERRSSSTELLTPAPVQPPPATRPAEAAPRGQSSSTVHLPDVDASSQQGGNAPPAPQPAPQSPGRIQIIVAPPGGAANAGPSAANTGSGSAMSSQVHEAAALDAQKRGDYRMAVTEYLKALDHSGDRSAYLHQLIGLCYQRLGQNESAIAHYKDAIADYNRLLAAGKNVDAANRGIKACEEGIKACQ